MRQSPVSGEAAASQCAMVAPRCRRSGFLALPCSLGFRLAASRTALARLRPFYKGGFWQPATKRLLSKRSCPRSGLRIILSAPPLSFPVFHVLLTFAMLYFKRPDSCRYIHQYLTVCRALLILTYIPEFSQLFCADAQRKILLIFHFLLFPVLRRYSRTPPASVVPQCGIHQ